MFDCALAPATKLALNRLSSFIIGRGFYLAGGTGCAIHLGHRISCDLDFFTSSDFSPSDVSAMLRRHGDSAPDYTDAGTWVGNFQGTKVGFFRYSYPLVGKTVLYGEIPIASLEDIGCMKIEAIAGRGRKRDFVDLYFILKETQFALASLLGLFRSKFGPGPINLVHVLKSLIYFPDADADPDPLMLVDWTWAEIKGAFVRQVETIPI